MAKTFGSSPRPPGSLLVLSAFGRFAGSVSGGCIEYDLTARLRENRMPAKLPGIARLDSFGVSRESLARLHGPVGLPIGSKTPAEIAVAVLAGITAVRRGVADEARTQAETDRSRPMTDIVGVLLAAPAYRGH